MNEKRRLRAEKFKRIEYLKTHHHCEPCQRIHGRNVEAIEVQDGADGQHLEAVCYDHMRRVKTAHN